MSYSTIRKLLLLQCSIIYLTISHSAFAQWSNDPSVNNAICSEDGYQDSPQLISDGSGGTIITWQDERNIPRDIYAQRIDSSGTIRWQSDGTPIVTNYESSVFVGPVIVSDDSGGAIIVWMDQRNDDGDIYAQRINSSGTAQWDSNGIAICKAPGYQAFPQVTADGAGGAIICWQYWNGNDWDLFAQRIDASGTSRWTASGVAISEAAATQGAQKIVNDGSAGAIIIWEDFRNDEWDVDIYAQKIDSSGAVQWTVDGVQITDSYGRDGGLAAISDDAGGAVFTWSKAFLDVINQTTQYYIYAQRIDIAGIIKWQMEGIPVCKIDFIFVSVPRITSDGSGGVMITWGDSRNDDINYTLDIYAQSISSSGAARWATNGVPVNVFSEIQTNPMAISDGSDGALIIWQDYRNSGSDIYGQRINLSGEIQWLADGLPISLANGDQSFPKSISDGFGNAIITWVDKRNGYYNDDIYAQRVYSNGSLITAVKDEKLNTTPADFSLSQNYPNPFNPVTTLSFAISHSSFVTLKVYDVLGREVATLVNGERKAGDYQIQFDGSNLPSGVYFYSIAADNFSKVKKMTLIK